MTVDTARDAAPPGAPTPTPRQVAALLAVARVVSGGGTLEHILDGIAAEVASVADGAVATSILLLTAPENPLRIGGSHGLSTAYRQALERPENRLRTGYGPSGLAVASGRAVVIEDTATDERIRSWRPFARREGYSSLVSTPMRVHERIVGALNVYRRHAGGWADEEVALLAFLADHAANAVRTAQLLDESRREVLAQRRLLRSLRAQSHEHANRLYALGGLLHLGAHEEAQRFLATIQTKTEEVREVVARRIRHPVLAGLLVAEAAIADQRDVALEFDEACDLATLPASLSDAQGVAILGNLLDNAFDAVAEQHGARRRVRLLLRSGAEGTIVRVRDWGDGLGPEAGDPFRRGASTKDQHAGVGLAIVLDAVNAAHGRIAVASHEQGTSFTVEIPGP